MNAKTRKFETVGGGTVEIDITQESLPCRHDHIEPRPVWQDEYEQKYQCCDCGMTFNALEFEAIRQIHIANQKPLTAADFEIFEI